MPVDLPFACQCGAVEGVLKNVYPNAGKRYACYCDDCQAYIFHLGREADFLDDHGANEIFQTTPARLSLTKGLDKIAPLKVTKRNIYRWRTTCCQTPIAVTVHTPMLPFVSMHTPLFRQHRSRSCIRACPWAVFYKPCARRRSSEVVEHTGSDD